VYPMRRREVVKRQQLFSVLAQAVHALCVNLNPYT
jgi:hypothetical protein